MCHRSNKVKICLNGENCLISPKPALKIRTILKGKSAYMQADFP